MPWKCNLVNIQLIMPTWFQYKPVHNDPFLMILFLTRFVSMFHFNRLLKVLLTLTLSPLIESILFERTRCILCKFIDKSWNLIFLRRFSLRYKVRPWFDINKVLIFSLIQCKYFERKQAYQLYFYIKCNNKERE
jgi:hypothetical protein